MTAFSDFIKQIQALGIQKDDTVTLHTSLKAIGEIDYPEKTGYFASATNFAILRRNEG